MSIAEHRAAYPYLYETHLHTSEASRCGKAGGAEMARVYRQAGYTGVFVTDHNWGGNTALDRHLPWEEFLEGFFRGYEAVRSEGERIGLDVFFGWEAGYNGTEFLIYGLSKEWLLSHPQIRNASVAEQFRLVHEGGGLVIHAHPFREEAYIPKIRLFPEYVDGVEGINAMHSNSKSRAHADKTYDEKAVAYAKQYDLPMTAGSDMHVSDILGGGMAFSEKLQSGADFVERIRARAPYLLTNGEEWFDRDGNRLA